MRAYPRSPGERATDWVNYALAVAEASQTTATSSSSSSLTSGGISFLHTEGQNMTWWQVLLLDVLLLYVLAVAGAVLLLVKGWQLLRRALVAEPPRSGVGREGTRWQSAPGRSSSNDRDKDKSA
jgi:hypothetical protein